MFEEAMFRAPGVKMTDICCLCNCMHGHCMEDDTKPTGYETKTKEKRKGYVHFAYTWSMAVRNRASAKSLQNDHPPHNGNV